MAAPPETRRDPIPLPIHHKGPAWKPDNLIAPPSRFIINIFIKLIAEKSPGLLEQQADSFARGSSYRWWGCCQWNKPRLSWSLRPHDRQIAALCESDMGNLERRTRENVGGVGDNLNCAFVLAGEDHPGATWKGEFFLFFYVWEELKMPGFALLLLQIIDQRDPGGHCCTIKQKVRLWRNIYIQKGLMFTSYIQLFVFVMFCFLTKV